ncbi:MAG: hypothetical protein ACK4MG_07955 [Aquabacterium sp.]
MKLKPEAWLLLASLLLLTMSLTGCASRCGPDVPSVVVQDSRPPQIRPELLERESPTYSESVRQKLSDWGAKLTASP